MIKASCFGTTSHNQQEIVLNDLEQQLIPKIKVSFLLKVFIIKIRMYGKGF